MSSWPSHLWPQPTQSPHQSAACRAPAKPITHQRKQTFRENLLLHINPDLKTWKWCKILPVWWLERRQEVVRLNGRSSDQSDAARFPSRRLGDRWTDSCPPKINYTAELINRSSVSSLSASSAHFLLIRRLSCCFPGICIFSPLAGKFSRMTDRMWRFLFWWILFTQKSVCGYS